MKRIILWAFACMPLAGLAQEKSFTLTINADKYNIPAKAYIYYTLNGKGKTDSAMITSGIAEFKGTVSEPTIVSLIIDPHGDGIHQLSPENTDVTKFFIESGKTSVSANDSVKYAIVKGSKINDDYSDYKRFIAPQFKAQNDLVATLRSLTPEQKKDTGYRKNLIAKYDKAVEDVKNANEVYIKSYPNSYVSIYLLNTVIGAVMDVNKIEPLFKGLSPAVQNTLLGQKIGERIKLSRATVIGAMAPVFTQNDTVGKPVSLTDFRGKYVLIDFWASWCAPCRAENPYNVKAYNQYKNKGFTILGISLDRPGAKDAWMAAIKKDGVTWTQVSDLKFFDNDVAKLYGVRAIPQNFLIDPQGKIVAANLRGDDLDIKLAELFNDKP